MLLVVLWIFANFNNDSSLSGHPAFSNGLTVELVLVAACSALLLLDRRAGAEIRQERQ